MHHLLCRGNVGPGGGGRSSEDRPTQPHFVRSEVLTAAVINTAFFWDTAPFSPYVNGCFGGTYKLHLQGRKSCG
jgi:hypothetical protein